MARVMPPNNAQVALVFDDMRKERVRNLIAERYGRYGIPAPSGARLALVDIAFKRDPVKAADFI
jgi:hypothetical protein